MSNRFAKAAANTSVNAKSKKDEGEIILASDPQVRKAIDEFVKAKEKYNEADSEKKLASATAMPWCRHEFLKRFAENGSQPEKLKFRGDVEQVFFIAQDRSGQYDVPDEQLETLRNLLGGRKTEQFIKEYTDFSFDVDILNKPGVMDALSTAIDKMVSSKVLKPEEAEKLLVPKARRVIQKGIVDKLAQICDGKADLMEAVVEALGSHFTMYLR